VTRSGSDAGNADDANDDGGEAVTEFHKGGTVCARGRKWDGQLHGYWEWFRKDGTRMRSGSFDRGVQVGQWTTYDAKGNVYKVTTMKAAPPPERRS
jgi:antitoxin component YwqK of YwqJK toxin-antitoxin module